MYIRNFLTLLRRYTTSSVLNIAGMAVAFAAVYLIAVQVKFDLSYNRVIKNSERIYRLEYPSWSGDGTWACNWNRQLPDEISATCPEIVTAGSIDMVFNSQYQDEYSIRRNSTIENFTIKVGGAELGALAVFPFEFVEGGIDDEFKAYYGMIISETVAKRYNLKVGDRINYGRGAVNQAQRTISGIYRDFPKPSTMAMSQGYILMPEPTPTDASNWNTPYYILLHEGASPTKVAEKMKETIVDYCRKRGLSDEDIAKEIDLVAPRLTPIADLYFADDTEAEYYHGSRTTTYTLIAIAVLILVISFINFVNFFFALIPSRIRAVNNYKIFGAPTAKLRLNFLFETVGLILVSLFGAAVIVVLFADTPLKEYISTSVAINENWSLAGAIALGVILFGVVVSLYPAWYITKFSPAFVIKGDFSASKSGRILRYTLVGIQYVISITLIICSLFIYRQHQYMLSRDMGFDKEHLLVATIPYEAVNGAWSFESDYTKRDALMDKLYQNPQIKAIAWGRGEFTNSRMQWTRPIENGESEVFNVYAVSWNFLDVMGIQIVDGRNFTTTDEQSETGVLIFNQTAAKNLNIDTETSILGHIDGRLTPVVGICKDFDFQSAQYNISPYAFLVFGKYAWDLPRIAYIRTVAGADIAKVKEFIVDTVMELEPNIDPEKINVKFFDNELEMVYQREDKLSTLVTLFSFLSIVISIIGVFGLVLFETQYRRREIGIRRVHGASVGEILSLFNRKYLYIVAICSAVAIPVSYYIIDSWMQQYVYRTPMSWWVYALAVGVILLITIVTVSLRSWSAANENPTNSIMH
ncbi:MAG: ABC transporter permease [Tidjanibacter sp.]|nr:ABC transporter permease [Tidjanibacter sp.]